MVIQALDPDLPAARELLKLSDEFTLSLYPTETIHLASPQELKERDTLFVGLHIGADIVGCGAVRLQSADGGYGEIMRVFIRHEHRGMGYAKHIVSHLEQHIRDSGFHLARLITGAKQTNALNLYKSLGYHERGAFGVYTKSGFAVLMEKSI